MNIVTDENVDTTIVEALQSQGIEVLHIGTSHPGVDDEEVLSIANNRKAVLLTEDKDFGELVYRLKMAHYGIVLVRLSGLESAEKSRIVLNVIQRQSEKLERSFTVISHTKVRIRKLE